MADWPRAHKQVLDAFVAGWQRPGPHAWDNLLASDVEFVQPMLRDGRGPEHWWDEAARLTTLLPDLKGDVVSWSAVENTMYIHVRFTATLGGKPLSWRAVDVLQIDDSGFVLHRESFFDPTPLSFTVLCRPRAWVSWWRSGIAPLDFRRRLQRKPLQLMTGRSLNHIQPISTKGQR